MNDDNKTVWINAENKILSFHATENGKVIQKTEKSFEEWIACFTELGRTA